VQCRVGKEYGVGRAVVDGGDEPEYAVAPRVPTSSAVMMSALDELTTSMPSALRNSTKLSTTSRG